MPNFLYAIKSNFSNKNRFIQLRQSLKLCRSSKPINLGAFQIYYLSPSPPRRGGQGEEKEMRKFEMHPLILDIHKKRLLYIRSLFSFYSIIS
jgi:hypothetical protein